MDAKTFAKASAMGSVGVLVDEVGLSTDLLVIMLFTLAGVFHMKSKEELSRIIEPSLGTAGKKRNGNHSLKEKQK